MEVNWRSQRGVKAGRAGTLRAIRLRVEKELTRYLETAESDKRVKGRVLHLAKRYEKKQWLAAVSWSHELPSGGFLSRLSSDTVTAKARTLLLLA